MALRTEMRWRLCTRPTVTLLAAQGRGASEGAPERILEMKAKVGGAWLSGAAQSNENRIRAHVRF